MSEQRLITGDSLVELPKMASESVDLVIADPPYNLGKNYGNNRDSREFEEYLEFSKNWLSEVHRLLKPHGTIYVFMGFRFIAHLYIALEQELNMLFNSWIVWHYTQGIGKKRGFSPRHDDILMFTKSPEFVFNLNDVRIPQKYFRERNNMRGANPGDVWEFSHVHYCNGNRQNHPTQKPEGLIERLVLASSHEGDSILDPFMGSGTTLRVCQQLNRSGIGIDVNPEYVSMAKNRLQGEFAGFDSVDPRTKRVPLDLHNASVRQQYLEKHKVWFLSRHSNAIKEFERLVKAQYPDVDLEQKQMELL